MVRSTRRVRRLGVAAVLVAAVVALSSCSLVPGLVPTQTGAFRYELSDGSGGVGDVDLRLQLVGRNRAACEETFSGPMTTRGDFSGVQGTYTVTLTVAQSPCYPNPNGCSPGGGFCISSPVATRVSVSGPAGFQVVDAPTVPVDTAASCPNPTVEFRGSAPTVGDPSVVATVTFLICGSLY